MGSGLPTSEFLVAVEKGWLARCQPIRGFADEQRRYEVGRRLSYLHRRPAFDPRFVECVQQPLVQALRGLAKADPEGYEQLHQQVHEIGVETNSNLSMPAARVWAFYEDSLEARWREWLDDQWTSWAAIAASNGLNLLPLRIEDLGIVSARRVSVANDRSARAPFSRKRVVCA